MDERGRVLAWFERGALVRPSAAAANAVDLAQALASLAGASDVRLSPNAARIAGEIGGSDHLVFVLADGLGMHFVETLPEQAFFRAYVAMELQTVFPSTTVAALTAFATSRWPNEHAAPAWWTHLPEFGVTSTILPFIERYTRKPLEEFGATGEAVFPHGSLFAGYTRDVRSFQPAEIAGSTYSRYMTGGTPAQGYATLEAAVDTVAARVEAAARPTYTYLYVPHIDAAAHRFGTRSSDVRAVIADVQGQIARMAERLGGRARIVLTADHGLIDATSADREIIRQGDPLLELLDVPPHGEPRVPFFHARAGREGAFEAAFHGRFSKAWALLTIAEAEALELFGPGAITPRARERIGTHIALTAEARVFVYEPPGEMAAYHGGLQGDEMRVPLILA